MRILHLAYEDPRRPGSGGGSVRTYEINRRLAERHEITAVVAGYPGARERVEDGVRWIPIGTHTGTTRDQLTYFALLPSVVRRHLHDLVVEDFGAPFSTGFAPLFTRKPVVASVQWLFAREKRIEYGLPFDWVESLGLGCYHDFIAVSDWLAGKLRARRPRAVVEAIPNGVDPLAFTAPSLAPRHYLYVGRLEIEHKGCDLLLESMALIHVELGDATPPLVVVGDGPDRERLEARAGELGLTTLVQFRGRVEGAAKYALMAAAYAVLIPSRYETFGMVAVESLAAGAPVVAFRVGPLEEVAAGGATSLAPPFDVVAFAAAAVHLFREYDAADLAERRRAGRRRAGLYDWDALAPRQDSHYHDAVARGRVSRSTVRQRGVLDLPPQRSHGRGA